MRRIQLSFLGSILLMACGTPSNQTGTETDAGASSSGGESSTSDNPTTGSSGGQVCVPGMSVGCACPDGTMSAQVCNPDGKGFGMCGCDGGTGTASDSATTGSMTSGPVTTDSMTSGPMTTDAMTSGPMTTGPMTTGGSTGGMGGCNDPGPEPNEDEMSAVDLGDQSCQADPKMFMGVLDGDADVDWFRYHGLWVDQCGQNDPDAVQNLTASGDVRMCVFADCDNSMAQFDCGGAQDSVSPGGLPGCCDNGSVSFVLNCVMNPNESAQIFVRLDQAAPDSCVDYSVEYSYQPG